MAIDNPAVIRTAFRDIGEAHPEFSAEQIDLATSTLNKHGMLSLSSEGRLFIDLSSEQKLQLALRTVPNLVKIDGDSDRDRASRAMTSEARAEKPAPKFNAEKAAAEIAKIPPLSAGASDRQRAERAVKVEQAFRRANFTESNAEDPKGY